jgi:hypothetical protein
MTSVTKTADCRSSALPPRGFKGGSDGTRGRGAPSRETPAVPARWSGLFAPNGIARSRAACLPARPQPSSRFQQPPKESAVVAAEGNASKGNRCAAFQWSALHICKGVASPESFHAPGAFRFSQWRSDVALPCGRHSRRALHVVQSTPAVREEICSGLETLLRRYQSWKAVEEDFLTSTRGRRTVYCLSHCAMISAA